MRSIILFVFAALLLTGCTRILDVNNPNEQPKQGLLKLNMAPQSGTEWTMGASKLIDGSMGGTIYFSKNYISEAGRRISVNITLSVPRGAFQGKQVIGFNINSENGVLDCYPSPMTFDVPLKLDYSINGVDLSTIDCSLVDFFYIDSDDFVKVSYDNKYINQATGTLILRGAMLNHFSRYGWGTIVDPENPGNND